MYEYIFSHGHGSGDLFNPDNIHFYIPEASMNLSSFVRTIVKGSADTNETLFLDSDSKVSNNFYRDVPNHIDTSDGVWHMYTLVASSSPEYTNDGQSGSGYTVYIDGRYTGMLFLFLFLKKQ